MKINLSMLMIVCIVSCLPISGIAQDTVKPKPLTLQECIDIAKQQQIDVLTGLNSVESSKARVTRAKSSYFPQVSVQDSRLLAKSGTGRLTQSNGTNLTVSQNFYDGGIREAGIHGATADAIQTELGLERIKQSVTFNVTIDYLSLLRAVHQSDIQDARVKYLEEELAIVHGRIDEGDAALVDSFPVEAQLANAKVDQLTAKNNIRTAAIQLQNTMGLTPTTDFEVAEFDGPKSIAIKPLDEYISIALATRPEVPQSQAAVESAQASLTSAKIVLYPRPVVTGSYDQTLGNGNQNSMMIIGGIVYDLFDGSSNRAAYREAKSSELTAKLRAEQTDKDITSQVQSAYLDMVSANERLTASDLSLKAAQKNLDAQKERYALGSAIALDLLNAQSEVVTAQTNAVQARYDLYSSIAQLEYAVGKQGGLYGN